MASSGAAPRPIAQQRTIGEILLAHGYVSEDQLDKALERQRETGFPLGQILVEAGAITRLELASALAVQWSDMPIAVRPEDGDRRGALPAADGAERKARVAPATDPAWQEELSTTVRALGARLEHVEASLSGLTSNEDGTEVQRAVEELQARVDASEAVLAETARRLSDSVSSDDLEKRLGTVAAELETALSRADELEGKVAPLAARVTAIAAGAERTSAELERRSAGVTEAFDALGRRVEERSTATLREMRTAIAALAERPSADPALAARVDELAARVDEQAGRPRGDETLAARVDELARRVTGLPSAEQLEEIDRVVAALAERPSSDPVLAARLDELAERVAAIDQRSGLSELRRQVEELSSRPASDPELSARVAALAARIDSWPDLATFESLRNEVAALAERPATDAALQAWVEQLSARIATLADTSPYDELRARLDEFVAQPSVDSELAERLDDVGARLAALAELGPRSAVVAERVDTLSHRVAEVTEGWNVERTALEQRLGELAARLERSEQLPPASALPPATPVPGAPPAEGIPADDLNRLWFAVERISLQLTEQHRDIDMLLARNDDDGRVDELVARLEDLEEQSWATPAPNGGPSPAADGPGPGLHTVTRKLAELEKLAKSERERLLGQIEQMMGSLEWRLQRLESNGSPAPPLGS